MDHDKSLSETPFIAGGLIRGFAAIKGDYEKPPLTTNEEHIIHNALANEEYPFPTPDQSSAAKKGFEEWTDPRNVADRALARADDMDWGDDDSVPQAEEACTNCGDPTCPGCVPF